jgi:hypothetical protein
LGRSELKLYVDQNKFEFPFTYPKISDVCSVHGRVLTSTQPVTTCYIGMNGKIGGTYIMGGPQPLFGQLSSLFFFQEALQPAEIKELSEVPLR